MAEDEVGSLGQETLKLLRVLAAEAGGAGASRSAAPTDVPADRAPLDDPADDTADLTSEDPGDPSSAHVCTTGWCPVCRLVGFVKENPDVVDEVAASALHLARTLRDAFDVAVRQAERDAEGRA